MILLGLREWNIKITMTMMIRPIALNTQNKTTSTQVMKKTQTTKVNKYTNTKMMRMELMMTVTDTMTTPMTKILFQPNQYPMMSDQITSHKILKTYSQRECQIKKMMIQVLQLPPKLSWFKTILPYKDLLKSLSQYNA